MNEDNKLKDALYSVLLRSLKDGLKNGFITEEQYDKRLKQLNEALNKE